MNNKCVVCETLMEERTENVKWGEAGLNITLRNTTVMSCPNCGEREVGVRAIESLYKTIARYMAEKPQRLVPAEIRFLRKYLGLSSTDFAAKMGVDKSTVSRWESPEDPQPMGVGYEKVLRILALAGKKVEKYPLEEMASQAPAPLHLMVEHDSNGWHAKAA